MAEMYKLYHIHEILEDEEARNVKILGIFTSIKKVNEAIKRYKELSGFRERKEVFRGDEYGEGFFISKLTVGVAYWDGGYTTMEDFAASYGIKIVDDDNNEAITEQIIDVPNHTRGKQPQSNESSSDFAARLMDEQYKPSQYPKGPHSEFYQIKQLKECSSA